MRVVDFMPRRGAGPPRLMRIVEGARERVALSWWLGLIEAAQAITTASRSGHANGGARDAPLAGTAAATR